MTQRTRDISKQFSIESLEAINAAAELAYSNNQNVCTPMHLLLILLESPIVQELLNQRTVELGKIRSVIKNLVKDVQYPQKIKKGKVTFSPELRKVILNSYLVSKKTNGTTVGIEDLALACVYTPAINKALNDMSFNVGALEDILVVMRGGKPESTNMPISILDKYTTNLTEKAKSGALDPVVNREQELGQVTRILVRKAKNNIVLLGENGVGRASIVHLIAQRIASGQMASQLANTQILELNLSGLLTAIASRNASELGDMLEEELRQAGNVVLFIKDFETLMEENSIEKNFIGNTIKSLISSGSNRFILSMTASGYRKVAAKEMTLMEKFATIKVAEPSIEQTITILQKLVERMSKFHSIQFESDVIEKCAILSKRYIQDQFLPSKAIDLLDEASSKVSLEKRTSVTVDDIKAVISEKTGIPIEKLTVSEQKKLINLEEILNRAVIGQKEAVHVVSEVIRRSRAGLKDPKKPIGSFLFLGPSGVGKTFLAKNLAHIVYDNENAMIRLDMSEFHESHTVQRLIGSPPGYVGYEEGGQLTNPVWEKPYSLILLDEIEKANAKVFDIFLQVLDEGRLTDGQGRTVDFKNTIIIATSNIASTQILEKLSKKTGDLAGFEREQFYEKEILPILKEHFRPEFINRFDEIVVFNPLGVEVLKIIARQQIAKIQERLKDKQITINVSDEKIAEYAQNAEDPAFGARPLIRLIQEKVENLIASKIISGEIKEGEVINIQ